MIRPQMIECGVEQNIPRVLTVEQLTYPNYQQVPVSIHAYTPDISDRQKNLTFDQLGNRNRVIANDLDRWSKNKSTDKA